MNFKRIIWIFPLLLAFFISLNFFWSKQFIPGFDTPFYLTEIRSFSRAIPNPLTYPYLDRYLTIAFPGLLSKLFGLDPVISYRVAITTMYLVISLVLFKLFKNITKRDSLAAVLSSALVVSPFLITYSTMLFANFAGFLVLFSFFAIETGKNLKYKNLILGVLLGLIFYVHNFSTVSIGLIVGFYYLLKLIFTKDPKVLKSVIIIFLITCLVGFVGLSRYLGINLNVFSHPDTASSAAVSITVPTQPVVLGNEKQRILDSFREYSGKYWLYFFPLSALIFLILSAKDIKKNKNNFLVPLAIFLPSVLFTLQPLFHLNFLPERFASLVILSTYFFYIAFITLPKSKKYLIPLSALPLFFSYLSSDSLVLNKGYRSISQDESQIYSQVMHQVPRESTILLSSDHEYWARYFLDGYNVISGDSQISCGAVNEPGYFGNINFTLAKLLSENDPQKGITLLAQLKTYFPNKTIYILTDTNLGCGHGRVLQSIPSTKQLFHQNSWYLYEIN